MDEIIRGTTPTFIFQDFGFSVAEIDAATFVVLQGKSAIIKKSLAEGTVAEANIRWTLTQAESLQLDPARPATVRCKWRKGTLCGVSNSLMLEVRNFGDDEEI